MNGASEGRTFTGDGFRGRRILTGAGFFRGLTPKRAAEIDRRRAAPAARAASCAADGRLTARDFVEDRITVAPRFFFATNDV